MDFHRHSGTQGARAGNGKEKAGELNDPLSSPARY
jgi:hypothetical protein